MENGENRSGGENPEVIIKTNFGSLRAELFVDRAPKTVANFLRYARDGHYDGSLFHRVVAGFVIQGGGLTRGMYLKPTGEPIENEAGNGLKNDKYTLAAARLPTPHSATSQFFVNLADNNFLDHSAPTDDAFGYCVFGALRDCATASKSPTPSAKSKPRRAWDTKTRRDKMSSSNRRASSAKRKTRRSNRNRPRPSAASSGD